MSKDKINFYFGMPRNTFSGRTKELEELKKSVVDRGRVVIAGLPGMGKAELVKQFVQEHNEKYDTKIWMAGENEGTLMNSFWRLAHENLKIEKKEGDLDIRSIVKEVYGVIEKRNSVVVFENVEEDRPDGFFHRYLPGSSCRTPLIITSGSKSWENWNVIEVQELSEDDAMSICESCLTEDGVSRSDAVQLGEEFHSFPLGFTLCFAFINRMYGVQRLFTDEADIPHYLKVLDRETTAEEKFGKLIDCEKLDAYEKVVLKCWETAFKRLRTSQRGQEGINMVNLISFFPESRIHWKVLPDFFPEMEVEIIQIVLTVISSYGMIKLDMGWITVHSILKKITRLRMDEETEIETLDRGLSHFEEQEVPIGASLWDHAAKHDSLVKKHSNLPKTLMAKLNEESRHDECYYFGKNHLRKFRESGSADEKDVSGAVEEYFKAAKKLGKPAEL